MVLLHGRLERHLNDARVPTGGATTGVRCVRAVGLRGQLGEQMVPVEMGGPGGEVGYRTKCSRWWYGERGGKSQESFAAVTRQWSQ